MSNLITHNGVAVETDGSTANFMEELGATRADFLKRAAIFGGGAVATASGLMILPELAGASKKSDIAILNFALTLEFLESTYYNTALRRVKFTNMRARQFARNTAAHEQAHVKAIRATIEQLGGKPVKRPKFNFGGAFANQGRFLQTAMALEDTGVSAYNGAGPALTLKAVKAAAASIVAVEALHASWVRAMVGAVPAPLAFDEPKTKKEVLAIAKPFFA